MRSYRRILAVALLALFLLMVSSGMAFARAGGGSHSSSGGSSSGSSSGGSSSSGSTSIGGTGSIGGFFILVIGAVVYLVLVKKGIIKKGTVKFGPNGLELGNPASGGFSAPVDASVAIEAQVKTTDPNFSLLDMKSRVNEIFYAVQTAWSKRDLKPVSSFMYPSLYRTWEAQIQDMRNRHVINIMETPVLQDVTPVGISQASGYDFLVMQITASATDYEVDEVSKAIVFPTPGVKPGPRQFREKWTFARKSGVATKGSRASLSHCPNCNAPATLEGQAVCEYCGTAFNNPDFDWVRALVALVDF